MRKLYLFAAMAAMLAACSSDDLTVEKQVAQQNADDGAVVFDAYVNRGITRAGKTGLLNVDALKQSTNDGQKTGGFGVMGYYTNDELYSQNSKPEFFYNQKVYYSGGWKYEPIKYWPNEFGNSAISESEDRLTFFAYAPYVPVELSTGIAKTTEGANDELETGIIALTRNTALGDPYVKYYVSFDPAKCVDLCWGVAKEEFTSSVDGNNNHVGKGSPYVNVKKPKLSDRIYFDFKHALAQLNVQIDADVDEMSHGSASLAANTKIYVREVTFEGFADKGMLNLNSEAGTGSSYTPKWYDLSGLNEIKSGKVTIYDGRRNGREGQINSDVANEKPHTLNVNIISDNGNTKDGVPADTPCNLFNNDNAEAPILVIPTAEQLAVTIVYDVETKDDNLATFLSDGTTHGSSVENKITKLITLSNGDNLELAAGKNYRVNLHLGMTSVKFEAEVTNWNDVEITNVDLPVNAPSYSLAATAIASMASQAITVPATASTGLFSVTGLKTTADAVTTSKTGTVYSIDPEGTTTANASGVVNVEYVINANETVENITGGDITVKDDENGAKLTITQLAAPLGLSVATPAKGGEAVFKLDATAKMATGKWADTKTIWNVTRTRGGITTTLTKKTGSMDGVNQYIVEEEETSTGSGDYYAKITLYDGDKAQGGDIYTITVQAFDAKTETTSFTVAKAVAALNPFSTTPYEYKLGEPVNPTQTTTCDGDGTITYSIAKKSGSGTTTATIDSNNGVVSISTPEAGDKFTVTATVADGVNNTYTDKTTTYEIHIVKSTVTSAALSFSPTNTDVPEASAGSAIAAPTLTKTGDGVVTYSLKSNTGSGEVTVNPSTGEVVLVGAVKDDVITIEAIIADSPNWEYGASYNKAEFTITITD
jgi:hypothetical protein